MRQTYAKLLQIPIFNKSNEYIVKHQSLYALMLPPIAYEEIAKNLED